MKKLILLLALCLTFNAATAQNNAQTMPSDEEILQTIRQYNFDKSKEELLFKKTKMQLQNYYKTGEIDVPDVDQYGSDDEILEPGVDEPKRAQRDSLKNKRQKLKDRN